MKNKFKGTGVALVTPLNEDHTIDFTSLNNTLDYTASNGVDFYVVQGTTGESVTMSKEEKKELLKFIIENNSKKLPVMYGLGGNNTAEVLNTIKNTDFTGVDAVLSVSPYYNRPAQEGIYQHFKAIADACPVPVMLYNVPARTGSNISTATTLRLAEHPNIFGTKEASGDLNQCMLIAAGMPKDFLLLSGDDMLTLSMIPFGTEGVISVLANAFPEKFCRMVKLGLENKFGEAKPLLFDMLKVNPLMYEESSPAGVKTAMMHRGIIKSNAVRLPLMKPSEKLSNTLKQLVREIS
jgi:4-hydroxy-tetrahydrodipicolinate synthase